MKVIVNKNKKTHSVRQMANEIISLAVEVAENGGSKFTYNAQLLEFYQDPNIMWDLLNVISDDTERTVICRSASYSSLNFEIK